MAEPLPILHGDLDDTSPADAAAMRLLIAWKLLKGAAVALAAVVLAIPGDSGVRLITRLGDWLSNGAVYLQPLGHFVAEHATQGNVTGSAVLAAGTATVMFIEAIGLHYRRRWAAWMTVVLTSSFIPLEIHELVARFHAPALIFLLLNVTIVIYLALKARRKSAMWGR